MTINLNDCESIEIIARDSAECMHKEYAYIGKKYGPFGTAWKLVRQREQAYRSETGDTPTGVDVFTSKLWNGKTEDTPLMPLLFTVSRSH
jgi:hypothetical protein